MELSTAELKELKNKFLVKYKEIKDRNEVCFELNISKADVAKWLAIDKNFAHMFNAIQLRIGKNDLRTPLDKELFYIKRFIKGLIGLIKVPPTNKQVRQHFVMANCNTPSSTWKRYIQKHFAVDRQGFILIRNFGEALANLMGRKNELEKLINEGRTSTPIKVEHLYNLEQIERPKPVAVYKIINVDIAKVRPHPAYPDTMRIGICVQTFRRQVEAYKYAEDYHTANAGKIASMFMDGVEQPKTIKIELADLLLSLLIHTEEKNAFAYLKKHLGFEEEA